MLPPGYKPDELLFDWSRLPDGATASIYLPAASADQIMANAASMYGFQAFTRIDGHTIGCKAEGTTFMPILAGSGNYAGLLTIDLPSTIRKGAKHTAVVSQITNAASSRRVVGHDAAGERAFSVTTPRALRSQLMWRKVLGTFALSIPIETKADILPNAERELSIQRWILNAMPKTARWYPVFLRYVGELSDRVDGLGGDSSAILPSGTGTWPGSPGERDGAPRCSDERPRDGDETRYFVGKIRGLVYDHFGDFEGFILETDGGKEFTFYSRERNVEEIARRSWAERLLITVFPEERDEHCPRRIVLHLAP